MLTKIKLTALYEYCKYFRFQAEKLTREAANSRSLAPELKAAIVKEQTRRTKELKRLETALEAEMDTFTEGSETAWPEHVESQNCNAITPGTKRKTSTGKKSTKRAACTVGRKSKEKNANASSTKRNPGRPRKAAPTE